MKNLNQIQTFSVLCETLSFTKTGQLLKIAQPAVSRQIRLLEEELGSKLFIRNKYEMSLTDAGLRLKKVIPLLDEIQDICTGLGNRSREMVGEIKICSLTEIGQSVVMPQLLELKKKHPNLTINLELLSETKIVPKLKSGSIDLAIISSVLDQEDIRSYKLFSERIVLVGGYNNKVKEHEIKEHSFISYRTYDLFLERYIKRYFPKTHKGKIKTDFIVNSHRSIVQALQTSNSLAVVPYHSVVDAIEQRKIKIVSPKELKSNIYLAHLSGFLVETRKKAAKEFLIKKIKNNLHPAK